MLSAAHHIAALLLLLLQHHAAAGANHDTSLLDLPANHLPYYLHSFPTAIDYVCANDAQCMHQLTARLNRTTGRHPAPTSATPCWGYELGCRAADRFAPPAICHRINGTSANAAAANADTFFEQADFGYIREQTRDLITICEPRLAGDSSLECSPYLRFCRARGIRVDFTAPAGGRREPFRYRTDVLAGGQIGGRCRLHGGRLRAQLEHMSALQSWAPELQHFVEEPTSGRCDEIVERPTFVLKIDAAFNMYHHFCDFVNLYATMHANGTHAAAFSTDVQLLIWETYPYRSPFADTWRVFSRHPVQTLQDVRGRVVCYRNLVLPLLPRMIFGLYYNTPLIKNCANSGLFRAFSEHVLHRLRVPFEAPRADGRLRVTLLSRLTKYRNIVNVDELVGELARNGSYAVRKVSFERLNFTEQLAITRNTDIFIGIHGAGLTHLLFLPSWASLFELYNCNDESCYRDLARLRGVNYVTWQHAELLHSETPPSLDDRHRGHEKFADYRFDVREFGRLVAGAAAHVWRHPEYRSAALEDGSGVGGGGGSGHQSDEL